MTYGYYLTNEIGNQRFFVEGCSYCCISTGGQHEGNCPMKDLKIVPNEGNCPMKIADIPNYPFWRYITGGERIEER